MISYYIMKSFGAYFSSLLNITEFCKNDSEDDSSKTKEENEPLQSKSEPDLEEPAKYTTKGETNEKNEETFELIDIDDEYTDGLVDALLQQSN